MIIRLVATSIKANKIQQKFFLLVVCLLIYRSTLAQSITQEGITNEQKIYYNDGITSLPRFPGGNDSLTAYLTTKIGSIKAPKIVEKYSIVVMFTITENG
jgi:hypothetical protein